MLPPDVAWKIVTNLRFMTSHPCHEGLYVGIRRSLVVGGTLYAYLLFTFHFASMPIADTTNGQQAFSPSEVFKDGTMTPDVEQGLP